MRHADRERSADRVYLMTLIAIVAAAWAAVLWAPKALQ